MKSIEEIKKTLNEQMPILQEKYGVKKIGVFGSYLKGEPRKDSDLDLLVEFDRSIDLLMFINLENYLSDILGIKVELVMKDVLKPRIGKRILEEVGLCGKGNGKKLRKKQRSDI
jgi:predicted nucleotidyltransferase